MANAVADAPPLNGNNLNVGGNFAVFVRITRVLSAFQSASYCMNQRSTALASRLRCLDVMVLETQTYRAFISEILYNSSPMMRFASATVLCFLYVDGLCADFWSL